MATVTTTAARAGTPATQAETTPAAHARATRTLTPPVDIYETESAFVVLADMPGVSHDTLEVLTEADTLVIRGQAASLNGDADHQEFELGEFRRVFLMTEDLDTEQIRATLTDGVLRVEVPKSERMKPRRIQVKAT